MKHTKSMVIHETDESRELYLYAVNEGALYPMVIPVVRNLARKYAKGTYDSEKAIDAYYPIANQAAKRYCKEFCTRADIDNISRVFDVTSRYTAAACMEQYYRENVEKNDL